MKEKMCMQLDENLINIFEENKKCIINADLDGILSGMFLQNFLDWEIVGFSSCSGKQDDELWLFNPIEDITKCVFVDLPVWGEEYSTIDQHFVAYDDESIKKYCDDKNKINPNIIRKKVFKTKGQYSQKYPFGTVHFLLAVLENIGKIPEEYTFNFEKNLGNFDLADLIFRADRVIGNTASYALNCVDWYKWLMELGGKNTKCLFERIEPELLQRIIRQTNVEKKMKELGCKGIDGDCSNMLRDKNDNSLKQYFDYLASAFEMRPIPVTDLHDFGKLNGERYSVSKSRIEDELLQSSIFSFAFVNSTEFSVTYLDD